MRAETASRAPLLLQAPPCGRRPHLFRMRGSRRVRGRARAGPSARRRRQLRLLLQTRPCGRSAPRERGRPFLRHNNCHADRFGGPGPGPCCHCWPGADGCHSCTWRALLWGGRSRETAVSLEPKWLRCWRRVIVLKFVPEVASGRCQRSVSKWTRPRLQFCV